MHRLAWSLDACLKDRVLDEKRMRELHQFFLPMNRKPAGASKLSMHQPKQSSCSTAQFSASTIQSSHNNAPLMTYLRVLLKTLSGRALGCCMKECCTIRRSLGIGFCMRFDVSLIRDAAGGLLTPAVNFAWEFPRR